MANYLLKVVPQQLKYNLERRDDVMNQGLEDKAQLSELHTHTGSIQPYKLTTKVFPTNHTC